jgi:A/G-specific adenine glycosylase
VVLERRGRLLLMRRPEGGRWAGLWEFPHIEQELLESPQHAAYRLLESLGLRGEITGVLATLRHAVTRFQISLTCVQAVWRGGRVAASAYPEACWVRPAELAGFPISSPHRRLALCFSEVKSPAS